MRATDILLSLAILIALVTAAWQHRPHELLLLGGALLCLALTAQHLLRGLLTTPGNFR